MMLAPFGICISYIIMSFSTECQYTSEKLFLLPLLSVHLFLSVTVRKLAPISAFESQNVTNKCYLVCVQFPSMNTVPVVNKPYVNGVILREQNLF